MDEPIRKAPKKMLDAMKAIGNKKSKITVMEVVDCNGHMLEEYRDEGKDELPPQYVLEEQYVV